MNRKVTDLYIRIMDPDPDPGGKIMYGSTGPDPDPQHCSKADVKGSSNNEKVPVPIKMAGYI
jgi:hypothetical protein